MSYILDALRKADAQRERDPARGIHAQPLRGSGAAGPDKGLGPWLWGSAALGVATLAVAGWYLYPDSAANAPKVANRVEPPPARRPGADPQPAPVPGPVAAHTVPPSVAAPVPVVATVIEPPPPVARPVTPPVGESRGTSVPMLRGNQRTGDPNSVAPPVMAQLPSGLSPPAAAPTSTNPQAGVPGSGAGASNPLPAPVTAAPQPAPTTPAPTPAPFRPPPPPPPLPPAPPAPPAQPVAGLPADAPKLVITGGVYSTNPVQRMLIVNGQVLNEGSEVASGVVLEEIKPKGAVLRFRGSRYTVGY